MKLWLLKPFLRFGASFYYKLNGAAVVAPDCHLNYIEAGSLEVDLPDGHHTLPANSILYCPPGTPYHLDGRAGRPLIYSLNFDLTQEYRELTAPRRPQKINAVITNEALLPEIAGNDSFLSQYKIFTMTEGYLPYFKKIIALFFNANDINRQLAECALTELLIMLHAVRPDIPVTAARLASSVKMYLDENFKAEISLTALSSHFGYNENYLGRIFSSAYGSGILKYVLEKRLAEAKRLITETDKPLTGISEAVGFNDYAYFSSFFRAKCGISPRAYRAQARKLI